jgi:hypothetical protein
LIDLSRQFIAVKHGGELVDDVRYIGEVDVGALTVFLLDLPPGVSDQLPAIQDAILAYSSEPTMKDQVDYVAIYRVGEGEPVQMLAPTNFINGVENEFRVQPLDTDTGPTALLDTLAALLGDMSAIQPLPELRPSIVLITDGTDAVSEGDADTIVAAAKALKLPVHTIAVNNTDLGEFATEAGQEFLADLAQQTGGIGRILGDESTTLDEIWQSIAASRSDSVVRYKALELAAGTFDVELSLPDTPLVPVATTSVTIPGNIPTIYFTNESPLDENEEPTAFYNLGVATLEEAVRLHFLTESGWLDGQVRDIVAAQLVINGEPGPEIDPTQLADFSAEINGLVDGFNRIGIVIEDADGKQARTDDLLLAVSVGEASVPDALQPPLSWVSLLIFALLGIAAIVAIVWLVRTILRRSSERANRPKYVDPNPRPKQRAETTQIVEQESEPATTPKPAPPKTPPVAAPAPGAPQFELLSAATPLPDRIAITRPEFLIGSVDSADLALVDDSDVARIQATVIQDGAIYRLFGEADAPQMSVNDNPVPDYGIVLADGDVIAIGTVRLRFRQA